MLSISELKTCLTEHHFPKYADTLNTILDTLSRRNAKVLTYTVSEEGFNLKVEANTKVVELSCEIVNEKMLLRGVTVNRNRILDSVILEHGKGVASVIDKELTTANDGWSKMVLDLELSREGNCVKYRRKHTGLEYSVSCTDSVYEVKCKEFCIYSNNPHSIVSILDSLNGRTVNEAVVKDLTILSAFLPPQICAAIINNDFTVMNAVLDNYNGYCSLSLRLGDNRYEYKYEYTTNKHHIRYLSNKSNEPATQFSSTSVEDIVDWLIRENSPHDLLVRVMTQEFMGIVVYSSFDVGNNVSTFKVANHAIHIHHDKKCIEVYGDCYKTSLDAVHFRATVRMLFVKYTTSEEVAKVLRNKVPTEVKPELINLLEKNGKVLSVEDTVAYGDSTTRKLVLRLAYGKKIKIHTVEGKTTITQ